MSHSLKLDDHDDAFEAVHWFTPDRVVVRFKDTYALVDRATEDSFKLSSVPPSEKEKAVLLPLLGERGYQDAIVTVPAPVEDPPSEPKPRPTPPAREVLEYKASMTLKEMKLSKIPKPGFCYCGIALAIKHDHADSPNLDKCWCGLYMTHTHSHAAAPERPIARCHCGILLSLPHEHAKAYDPNDMCECGLPMNPPHEHAGRIRGH